MNVFLSHVWVEICRAGELLLKQPVHFTLNVTIVSCAGFRTSAGQRHVQCTRRCALCVTQGPCSSAEHQRRCSCRLTATENHVAIVILSPSHAECHGQVLHSKDRLKPAIKLNIHPGTPLVNTPWHLPCSRKTTGPLRQYISALPPLHRHRNRQHRHRQGHECTLVNAPTLSSCRDIAKTVHKPHRLHAHAPCMPALQTAQPGLQGGLEQL